MLKLSILLLLLLSCSPAGKEPEPVPAVDPIPQYYASASGRLLNMLDGGWVVSRENSIPEHTGDSLLWTGIALTTLSCERGQVMEQALLGMVKALDGGFWRHPTIPNDVSVDGAIGAYRGIAYRITHCPGSAALWRPWIEKHVAMIHDLRLNPYSTDPDDFLPGELKYVPDLLLARAVDPSGSVPDSGRLDVLDTTLAVWTAAVKVAKKPCYRVNLGYQALKTIEELGVSIPPTGKDQFCGAAADLGLATVEHWCGRPGLKDFIDDFQYDLWEYKHQRCVAWESPDGKPGLQTPAVDYLEALTTYYSGLN